MTIHQTIMHGEKVLADAARGVNIIWLAFLIFALIGIATDMYIIYPGLAIIALLNIRREKDLNKLENALIDARRSL